MAEMGIIFTKKKKIKIKERKGYAYWNNYQCIIHSYRRNLGLLWVQIKSEIQRGYYPCIRGMFYGNGNQHHRSDGKYAGGYFSVVIGTGIGSAIHLGERINAGAGVMQRVIGKFIKNSNSELSEDEFMNTLVTIIVLFCASGTGIYGSIVSGMSGIIQC